MGDGRAGGKAVEGRRSAKPGFLVFAPAVLAAAVLGGGCVSGPCARISPEAEAWRPGAIMVFPAVAAEGAVSSAAGIPSDLVLPSKKGAEEEVTACLLGALKDSSGPGILGVPPEAPDAALAADIERISRQYLTALDVNPDLAASLGRRISADAVLLTAVLRYGPEAEGNEQAAPQAAQTSVGASRLSISTAAPRTVVYFNCGFRCRLLRLSDAAVIWDVSVSERQKRAALPGVTQEGVLKKAVSDAVAVFPYARRPEGPPPVP